VQTSAPPSTLYKASEIQEMFRIKARNTLDAHVRKGTIPEPIRMGGVRLWLKSEIDAAIAAMADARKGHA
jgi:predicted DNA-binding transcriptional regulator AlpA